MTATYTTVDKVVSLLRLYDPATATRLADSTTSDPSTAEVTAWIEQGQDYIDKATGHSWRTTTVTNEYHDVSFPWSGLRRHEIAINLSHRAIADIDENESDSIEIWNGTNWIDLASTASYTEGRANDYWVDYTDGILYLVEQRPWIKQNSVRITYRYGDSAVPSDIAEATEKYAALKILESDFYRMTLPQGPDFTPPRFDVINRWRIDIDRVIGNRTELVSVH